MAKSPKTPVVDRALILELNKLLHETGLTEIEIEQDGQRVRVARGGATDGPPCRSRGPDGAARSCANLRRRAL